MRATFLAVLSVLLFASVPFAGAMAQGSPNVTFIANVDDYPSRDYNDCWGYTAPDGREYALLGVAHGTSIIDITDNSNIQEVAFIGGAVSIWRDIKTYQHYAYVVNESSGGMAIIDLSNLPASASQVATYTGFSTSHNIYIDEATGLLFAEGSSSSPVRILSLADPVNPVEISTFGVECHDVYVQNNTAYVSEGTSGQYGIYDVSDPNTPVLLQRFGPPAAGYAHNAWASEDGDYVMTTEETGGKTVKMWDVQNLSNITLVDQYLAPDGLAHNAHIKGDYAYISHYGDGLRIVDVSDPSNIFEAGYYDTHPGPGGGFVGSWGGYPFFSSGKVLISDIETGLTVVFFEGAREFDPLDPEAPGQLSAFSDFNTPSSVSLTWNDPTHYAGGDTLMETDFQTLIWRDGGLIDSVSGGIESYNDAGLVDGESYIYVLAVKDVNDSLSDFTDEVSVSAGGSPTPSPPENLECTGDSAFAHLVWEKARTQDDGTFLDDLAKYYIYRDGVLIDSTASGDDTTYSDSPAGGLLYVYTVRSVDNESPVNVSEFSNEASCFVGTDITGPSITHTGSVYAHLSSLPAELSANVIDDISIVASVWVEYEINSVSQSMFALAPAGGDLFEGSFPFDGADVVMGDVITYRINAEDTHGNQSVDPSTGSFEMHIVDVYAADDFSAGTGAWTITNDGGTCVWDIVTTAVNAYQLPPSATGNLLGADSDECGSGTSLLSTATLAQGWDLTGMQAVVLSLDSDWRIIDGDDEAMIDISYDGGGTWENLLHYNGVEARNERLEFDISQGAAGQPDVKIRLISIQPGWDWWWVVDNIELLTDGVTITDVGSSGGAVPEKYALHANYPNPFNPSTTIRYDVRSAGRVSLKIYNVLGQLVKTLADGIQEAGFHSVVWDGRNEAGQAVASGVYVYRIEAGVFGQSRKMMFIK